MSEKNTRSLKQKNKRSFCIVTKKENLFRYVHLYVRTYLNIRRFCDYKLKLEDFKVLEPKECFITKFIYSNVFFYDRLREFFLLSLPVHLISSITSKADF